jgi:DNA-binding transcriptional MerR regulator
MENQNFPQPVLPDKIYFKVGEVSKIAGVPAHVLRFWESEFKKINPKRTPSGQRLYRKNDVEIILKIKHLLYEKKFTIEGARQFLKNTPKGAGTDDRAAFLRELRKELENIRKIVA